MKKLILLFLAIFAFLAQNTTAQTSDALNAAEIKLALNKLGKLCSVLYIGAHPDDDNPAVLAYLANEMQCRTAYLSLTRGEAGENLIGHEQGALLGVIRTQETLAARKIDGAEQFFTRAIDFGFSKSAEEAFRKWNKQEVLSDVVWVIRKFRPDVIITRFPPDASAGDGQHVASAILAAEAFKLAGDEKAFQGQLNYTSVWQPKRLLWNAFVREGDTSPANAISIDVGKFNPLLGKSYTEIAAESRTTHKSQGQTAQHRHGSRIEYFMPVDGEKATKNLLDGVETTWKRIKGSETIEQLINEANLEINERNSTVVTSLLLRMFEEIQQCSGDKRSCSKDIDMIGYRDFNNISENLIQVKRKEISDLIKNINGIRAEAISDEPMVGLNNEIKVNLTMINPLDLSGRPGAFDVYPMTDERSSYFPAGTRLTGRLISSNQNQLFPTQISIKVPAEKLPTHPYWLRNANNGFIQQITNQKIIGLSDNQPSLSIQMGYSFNEYGFWDEIPVMSCIIDKAQGKIYRPFVVAPQIIINPTRELYIAINNSFREIHLTVKNFTPVISGVLKLDLPEGWQVEPKEIPVNFTEKDMETNVAFTLTPTANAKDGNLQVFVEANGQRYDKRQITIDYPHIPQQTLFPDATAKLVKLDIKTVPTRIGYIMGAGDEIPDDLRQLGYNVRLLSDEDLQSLDLAANFDTIITGIRAYNMRETLKKQNRRLLDFVKNGGRMIVQHNLNDQTLPPDFAPFPLKLSSDRVTIEEAPVKFLAAQNALLNFPNKITDKDFEGWAQERGANFAGEFDRKSYTPVLEMHDPGESDKNGSLLIANYGKGTFIYTGIAFFRQLPAGVPGAYRLFVNLISRDK